MLQFLHQLDKLSLDRNFDSQMQLKMIAKKLKKQMKDAQRFDEQRCIEDDEQSSYGQRSIDDDDQSSYGGHECSIELNEGKLSLRFCDVGRLFGF